MGRKVWVTGNRNTHVHAAPNCRGLGTRPVSPVQVELAEVTHPVACRRCWPTAPRLRVWHDLCKVCGHSRPLPCPHNGAVQVMVPRHGTWSGRISTSPFDPDAVVYLRQWVWPERAYRYTLANSAQ